MKKYGKDKKRYVQSISEHDLAHKLQTADRNTVQKALSGLAAQNAISNAYDFEQAAAELAGNEDLMGLYITPDGDLTPSASDAVAYIPAFIGYAVYIDGVTDPYIRVDGEINNYIDAASDEVPDCPERPTIKERLAAIQSDSRFYIWALQQIAGLFGEIAAAADMYLSRQGSKVFGRTYREIGAALFAFADKYGDPETYIKDRLGENDRELFDLCIPKAEDDPDEPEQTEAGN